jgi:hypothetical protein
MDEELGKLQEVLAARVMDNLHEEIRGIGNEVFVSEAVFQWMTPA